MKIVVIGATGMVGSRVTAEALRREHRVTAVARHATPEIEATQATVVAADAGRDRTVLSELLADADAAVLSVRPYPGEEDVFVAITEAVLDAAEAAGVRLLVVGGAGPLRTPRDPDRLFADDPDYVQPQWRASAAASVTQLKACRRHPDAAWIYLSPPADLEPGPRTGAYRRGGDTLLTAADGSSRISAEDFAIAVLDELEQPSGDRHFTVGY